MDTLILLFGLGVGWGGVVVGVVEVEVEAELGNKLYFFGHESWVRQTDRTMN